MGRYRRERDMAGAQLGDPESERLALGAKEGNREARNALYLRELELVMSLARPSCRLAASLRRTRGNCPLDREDIEQQAFIEFCALIEEWEQAKTPFRAFVMAMLKWRLLHYVRSQSHYRADLRVRYTSALSGKGKEGDEPQSLEETVEDEEAQRGILSIESHDAWQQQMAPLDETLRRMVAMRYALDMTSREIAQAEGHTQRTVNRRLRTALNIIKEQMEAEG